MQVEFFLWKSFLSFFLSLVAFGSALSKKTTFTGNWAMSWEKLYAVWSAPLLFAVEMVWYLYLL